MKITCEKEYKKAHEEFCRLWDQKYTGSGLQLHDVTSYDT